MKFKRFIMESKREISGWELHQHLDKAYQNGDIQTGPYDGRGPTWDIMHARTPEEADQYYKAHPPIGDTTHHKIGIYFHSGGRGDPSTYPTQKSYLNEISEHLHNSGIKHEYSEDEQGLPTIYVPKDQSNE